MTAATATSVPVAGSAGKPRVLGLDLSLTGTGVATPDGSTFTINLPSGDADRRLLVIADTIIQHADGVDLAVLEDLPANAKSAGLTGMVQGAVRISLIRLGVPYARVTPASVKKYATGSGVANKVGMGVAAFKRFAREFPDDNQCDAFWLRAMGLDALGSPVVDLPAAQRAAMKAVTWPEVTR